MINLFNILQGFKNNEDEDASIEQIIAVCKMRKEAHKLKNKIKEFEEKYDAEAMMVE